MEDKLIKKFGEYLNSSYEETLAKSKLEEAKNKSFLHQDKYYKDKIYNETSDDILNDFHISLEFCEAPEQHDLWEYFRIHTSSIRTNKNYGRNIRILVKHAKTQKYIGIISLGSDIMHCGARDKYIEWNLETKKEKLKYIMNITTCVGLQPIAYNLNIGKLLVAICYSDTVLDYFKQKYDHDIACITTFSINGKSIQYDRMKEYLKYIGNTQGYAMTNIPDDLYDLCIKYLTKIKDFRTLSYVNKKYKITKVMNYLDISAENGHQRGIYIGFTSKDSIDFLKGKIATFTPNYKTLDDICEWWKERWAIQRFNHLKQEGRLKYKVELINALKYYNLQKVKASNEKKRKNLVKKNTKKLKVNT